MSFIRKNFLQACDVPKDLQSVVSFDAQREVAPGQLGLAQGNVDAIWQQTLKLYKTGIHPAISISVRHKGELILSRSVGHISGNGPKDTVHTKKTLVTPDSPFCIFSSSKAVTALLMHMLAEEGLVNVMDPVAFYTPEFAKHGKQNITIHQILAHRGGIPGLPANATVDTLWDEEEIWRLLCDAKPIITDGSQLAYHAITGGFVLEQVVKKVTGSSITEYIDKKIRQPMAMKFFSYGIDGQHLHELAMHYHTGFRPGLLTGKFIKRALGETLPNVEKACNDPRFQEAVIPSGNLVATADEMSAFFQMLLDKGAYNGKRICKAQTVARTIQEYGNRGLDRTLLIPMRYSAGMMLGDDPVGIWGPQSRHAYGHLGLANKLCWADPSRELAVAVLNSGLPLLGLHIPPLLNLIRTICNNIPVLGSPQTFSLQA
ncbi:MAG: beta-lactamase family protein [Gammaproteobacteria bacterium]|nr:beta-lactamase family protein [Gammaproteobacteria bacterium]MBT8151057.1 beta-lactamase family protein [Gammaproteobacteria bacterium]NND40427.1 beta-lactamase family protein [Pseudomonadales bacterium]NNL11199.1 beta-lactamase family protein [Pseudomonadales bacterium]NNM10737.1 beta-lactamase family protein [Pseudomonadales bacterium]